MFPCKCDVLDMMSGCLPHDFVNVTVSAHPGIDDAFKVIYFSHNQ